MSIYINTVSVSSNIATSRLKLLCNPCILVKPKEQIFYMKAYKNQRLTSLIYYTVPKLKNTNSINFTHKS